MTRPSFQAAGKWPVWRIALKSCVTDAITQGGKWHSASLLIPSGPGAFRGLVRFPHAHHPPNLRREEENGIVFRSNGGLEVCPYATQDMVSHGVVVFVRWI